MKKNIFLASIIILLISIYSLYSEKEKLNKKIEFYKDYKKLAITYKNLNSFNDLSKIRRFNYKKNKNKIEFITNNVNKIDKFGNKLFNSYILVDYLKLEKDKIIIKLAK